MQVDFTFINSTGLDNRQLLIMLKEFGEGGWSFAFERESALFLQRLIEEEEPVGTRERIEFNCSQCDDFTPMVSASKSENGSIPGYCERKGFSVNSLDSCEEKLKELEDAGTT